MAFNAKRYDTAKFEEGAWTEIMGGQFKIAKFNNFSHMDYLTKKAKEEGKDTDKTQRELHMLGCQMVAESLLKDWKDVTDGEGNEIAFNAKNAYEVLMENDDLADAILKASRDMSNFERQAVEKQVKKPRKRSTTS